MAWTKEKVEQLKSLLDDPRLERNDIARDLNVTLGALNAKIARLGLSAPRGSVANERQLQAASFHQRRRHSRKPPRPPYDDSTVAAIRRIDYERDVVGVDDLLTLEQRPDHGCRFPVGDVTEDKRVYCPNHRVQATSYCEYHLRMMYSVGEKVVPTPKKERQKEDA